MGSHFNPYIFIIVFVLNTLIRIGRAKFVRPRDVDGVQKIGGFYRFFVNLMTGITILMVLFAILGFFMNDSEMMIVFAVVSVVFIALTLGMRNKFNMSYQENEDYFIYQEKRTIYKVYYEDIIHWSAGVDEMYIQDRSQTEEESCEINCLMFRPEILLRYLI